MRGRALNESTVSVVAFRLSRAKLRCDSAASGLSSPLRCHGTSNGVMVHELLKLWQ